VTLVATHIVSKVPWYRSSGYFALLVIPTRKAVTLSHPRTWLVAKRPGIVRSVKMRKLPRIFVGYILYNLVALYPISIELLANLGLISWRNRSGRR
jgi:hypothetical protein